MGCGAFCFACETAHGPNDPCPTGNPLFHEYDEECICYRCTAERDRRRELAGRKPKP